MVRDLEMLRRKLEKMRDRLEDSGVERTFHMKRIMGSDCQLYQKSMNLFVDEDYEELRDLTSSIWEQFQIIEGKAFDEGVQDG